MSPPRKQDWGKGPAINVVMARLADLYARALRVDAARRTRSLEQFTKRLDEKSKP